MPRTKKRVNATEEKMSIPKQLKNVSKNSKNETVSVAVQTEHLNEIAELQEQINKLQLEKDALLRGIEMQSNTVPNSPKININLRSTRFFSGNKETIINSPLKGCSCKGNCSTKQCGCVKKSFKCGTICKCSKTCQNQYNDETTIMEKENRDIIEKKGMSPKILVDRFLDTSKTKLENKENQQNKEVNDEDKGFDPMVPKRELIRTPTYSGNGSIPSSSSPPSSFLDISKSLEFTPKKAADMPEVLKQENVNLDELNIVRVKCSKCNRKFYPWRVNIHEAVCRKV